jgi:4a-hydroxytetrahydrobiopterin dehydratase
MTDLHLDQKHCVPCEGGTAPLTDQREDELHSAVPDWQLNRETTHQISKEFSFKNFMAVLKVANQIGELAESEGHHPNLYLHDYKQLRVELTTHAIKGLSENDFIMAVKIEEIIKNQTG